MHSEWHLDIWKLCFIFTKILCILEKQQTIDIDSYFVEGIRNKEFGHPRRASHNTANAVEERANPYVPYVIVCLSRYLLSHLQILILHRLGSRF